MAKKYIEKIAIVGATGSVGGPITEHLLKGGKHTITAITRADSKSKMPEGVKVAKVDYEEESSLIEALTGQHALIITMGTMAHGVQAKLIEAAAKCKVGWIMPNEYCPDVTGRPDMGKDTMILPGVAASHEQIEKLGVSAWVGLICSFWYEFSLAVSPQAYGFDFNTKTVTFIDDGETKISASTWAQCGRAVASLFSLPIDSQDGPSLSDWKNKEVYIDSFLVSQRDMLASILRVTGEKEPDWTIQHESATERFKQGQEWMQSGKFMEGFQQSMYTRVFYKDGSGDYSDKLDNGKLGLPEEDLDECTKEAVEMVKRGYSYYSRSTK